MTEVGNWGFICEAETVTVRLELAFQSLVNNVEAEAAAVVLSISS